MAIPVRMRQTSRDDSAGTPSSDLRVELIHWNAAIGPRPKAFHAVLPSLSEFLSSSFSLMLDVAFGTGNYYRGMTLGLDLMACQPSDCRI